MADHLPGLPPRPFCTLCVPLPGAEPCREFRRGLCRSCYRKLREAGCDMRPNRPTGAAVHRNATRVDARTSRERLVDWLRTFTPDARERLLEALQAAESA